jgi:opacity protein-like surface antigen
MLSPRRPAMPRLASTRATPKRPGSGATAANPPPVLASSWAGFYLGLHGGYGWRDNDFSEEVFPLARIDGIRSRGGVFGGHAGYNWQFGRAVTGLEIDFSGADIRAPILSSLILTPLTLKPGRATTGSNISEPRAAAWVGCRPIPSFSTEPRALAGSVTSGRARL